MHDTKEAIAAMAEMLINNRVFFIYLEKYVQKYIHVFNECKKNQRKVKISLCIYII